MTGTFTDIIRFGLLQNLHITEKLLVQHSKITQGQYIEDEVYGIHPPIPGIYTQGDKICVFNVLYDQDRKSK